MIKAVINTIKYFKAPKNYFWRWSDRGDVMEWRNGDTICYRDDMLAILKMLSSDGVPSLGPILMILFACKKQINIQNEFFLIRALQPLKDDPTRKLLDDTIHFLKIINSLPENLRTGNQRIHLIYEVLGKEGFVFSAIQLREALDEVNSGRPDNLIFEEGEEITQLQIVADLQHLAGALKRFPTTESLAMKLKTGVSEIPAPAEMPIPELPPLDLLDQLADDPETNGLATLARRLIAALKIPMHSKGHSDLPLGGISDITNRGNYDKLLLSELAYDTDLLMARLVNNESLYFRREKPPENPLSKRTILIDSTLKMWGVPRVFALSAALACVYHSKHKKETGAYMLGGEHYQPVNLHTREGIIHSLEMIHHALDCGKSLESIIHDFPASAQNEYFLITGAGLLKTDGFHRSFDRVKESISFIITVNRTGELQFYQCPGGRTKLLSTTKFDLDELLYRPGIKRRVTKEALPEFIQQNPPALFFPLVRIKNNGEDSFSDKNIGTLTVTKTQRVLYQKKDQQGAMELLNNLEEGDYTFGSGGINDFFILVNNSRENILKLYKLDTATNKASSTLLSKSIHFAKKIAFKDNQFFIQTTTLAYVYNCLTNTIHEKEAGAFRDLFNEDSNVTSPPGMKVIRLDSDNVLTNIKSIFINSAGELSFGKHCVRLVNENCIKICEVQPERNEKNTSTEHDADYYPLKNKKIKFRKLVWGNGSEAVIDSRGLLHLRSSDDSISEITIVSVLGKSTACWASDNVATGSSHFINGQIAKSIPCNEFYKKYIQRFIDNLLNS